MTAQSSSPPHRDKRRLLFLDGLRALASLYVLLFHALTVHLDHPTALSWPLRVLKGFFGFGHLSVVFFIVLSGFSLMIPVARSGQLQLVGDFGSYVRRRARRILPPYYASLALALIPLVGMRLLVPQLPGERSGEGALSFGSIASHLLLVHNLDFDWAYRINGPAWSVASEWQIYFLFPLVLLPLWRRFGATPTILLAWLVGSLPTFLLPPEQSLYWACPWFIGSFAMGMAGAATFFSPGAPRAAARIPWFRIALLSFAVLFALGLTGKTESWPYPVVDLVVSVFALCMIAAGAQHVLSGDGRRNVILDSLAWRPFVSLSGFSYSLYLIQHPFLRLSERLVNRLQLSYETGLLIHLFVVVPAITGLAWVFAEFFERPYTGDERLLPWLRRTLSGRFVTTPAVAAPDAANPP
jgi:peptidoglycan/LPS O-acetylase OafA/YrhL